MSDKPKVKVVGSGSHDVSIILPDGSDLCKLIRISHMVIDLNPANRPILRLEVVIPEDELELTLANLELGGASVAVMHAYPKDDDIANQIKELEAENKKLTDSLDWARRHM